MDEQQPAVPSISDAPFYVQVRAEGHMINAYMAPRPGVQTDSPEPTLIGSIMRAACDATGGANGPLFREFIELMIKSMTVVCEACLGLKVQGFTALPGGSVAEADAADAMGKSVGHA